MVKTIDILKNFISRSYKVTSLNVATLNSQNLFDLTGNILCNYSPAMICRAKNLRDLSLGIFSLDQIISKKFAI